MDLSFLGDTSDLPDIHADLLSAPPPPALDGPRESVVMKRRRRKMRDKAQRKSLMMQSEQVEMIVRSFDKNNNGYILENDLKPLWDELGFTAVAKSSEAAKKEVVVNGKVAVDEFMHWWFDE